MNNFSHWFLQASITYAGRVGRLYTSSAIARDLNLNHKTASAWLKGASLPLRAQCIKIAEIYGIRDAHGRYDYDQVLRAAGHPLLSDTTAATLEELERWVTQTPPPAWSADHRATVQEAMIYARSAEAADWHEVVTIILANRRKPLSWRAERITSMMIAAQMEETERAPALSA